MAEPILHFNEVEFGWPDSEPLLSKFTGTLKQGQITALVGVSGCGKSTLLQLAAGLLAPMSGAVTNKSTTQAMVFQKASLLPWRTALENVCLPLELESRPNAREQAESALKQVGLLEAANKLPHNLSGGMQMRCAIARALVNKPDLLFLDEAFSALDALTRKEVHQLFLRLHAELHFTALLVTHDLEEAAFLADNVWVLKGPAASQCFDVPIEKARPRDPSWRHSPDFGAICTRLEEAL